MKLKREVITQKLGEKYVLFDNDTSTLHEINEAGFFIIEKLKKGLGKSEIVDEIIKRFKVGKKEAKKDLGVFLQDLAKKDLIVSKNK